ncbi:MAG: hypothetical protein WC485_00035 [Opitutaceae bacterium]
MKTTLKIDRNSLANVIRELIEDDAHGPMDPRLIYDSQTGEFSIESSLNSLDETEHVIAARVGDSFLESDAAETRSEIESATEKLREKMIADAVAAAMAGMDDDYIAEYVIGDLTEAAE